MKTLGLVVVVAALGCGGSGVDSGATLGSLSVSQQMTECSHLASEFPKMTVNCGSGVTSSVGTDPAQCSGSDFAAIPSTCTVTVGELESCDGALYDEGSAAICSGTIPEACAALLSAGSACG